ncbi:MAG TPA: hypothetical protein VJI71_00815 [Candidatus Norongarragalinales archaeon]|nr:hypothetical protein [Candidatus Norongarragalinales archaeon]
MTVEGDDLVKSCRHCWSHYSFGIRLHEDANGRLNCPNCKKVFVVENGFLKTL